MKRVYALCRGDTDEFSIEGIFSSEEKINRAMEVLPKPLYAERHTQEFELDEISDRIEEGRLLFMVSLFPDGSLEYMDYETSGEERVTIATAYRVDNPRPVFVTRCYCYAKGQADAVVTAQSRILEFHRSGQYEILTKELNDWYRNKGIYAQDIIA